MSDETPDLQAWIDPELEARVVAWVLGEASQFEAAELTRIIAEKPELGIFKRRIEAVHGLVKEAHRFEKEPMRLDPERRRKLLEKLGAKETAPTVVAMPMEPADTWRKVVRATIGIAALLVVLALLASISMPAYQSVQYKARITRELYKERQAGLARGEEQTLSVPTRGPEGFAFNGPPPPQPSFAPPVSHGAMMPMPAQKPPEQLAALDALKASDRSMDQALKDQQNESLAGRLADSLSATKALYPKSQPEASHAFARSRMVTAKLATQVGRDMEAAAEPAVPETGAVADAPQAMAAGSQQQAAGEQEPQAEMAQAAAASSSADGAPPQQAQQELADSKKELSDRAEPAGAAGDRKPAAAPEMMEEAKSALAQAAAPQEAMAYQAQQQAASDQAGAQQQEQSPRVVEDATLATVTPASAPSAGDMQKNVAGNNETSAIPGLEAPAPSPETNHRTEIANGSVAGQELEEKDENAQLQASGNVSSVPTTAASMPRANQDATIAGAAVDESGKTSSLSGANTFTGGTTLSAGTLQFDGGNAGGTVAMGGAKAAASDAYGVTDAKGTTATGVPRLGDVPVMGRVFENQNTPAQQSAHNETRSQLRWEEDKGWNPPVSPPASQPSSEQYAFAATSAVPAIPPGASAAPGGGDVSGSTGGTSGYATATEYLNANGATFPPGANAAYFPANIKLIIHDASSNTNSGDASIYSHAVSPPPTGDETRATDQPYSTFSLHVSDVSFELAKTALANGEMPDPESIRPEEFYNAVDYGDPAPGTNEKIACNIEQAAHPVLQQRNLVRIAVKVANAGRGAGQPLRLTVLLDTSGSMEREDRAASVLQAMKVLTSLLGPNDSVTLIGFARQPRLLADALQGDQAAKLVDIVAHTPSEGGTNLEEAIKTASDLAKRHFLAGAQNRVVMLTDGAANLGDADPAQLAKLVEKLRQQGISFDACGVGAEGLNDDVLEALTRKGGGRYYFLNTPEDAGDGFAKQLAGAFRPAAENVKMQVRFNPSRVGNYRLIGFEKHMLKQEEFRNDKVTAAQLAAEEAAVAVYQVQVLPEGEGELGEVFVRFRDPNSSQMVEQSWTVPYNAQAPALDKAAPSMQLAAIATLLAEKLHGDALANSLNLDDLEPIVTRVRSTFAQQDHVRQLVEMFEQTRRMSGNK